MLIISGANTIMVCIMAYLSQRSKVGYISSFMFCLVTLAYYFIWAHFSDSDDIILMNTILWFYSGLLMLVTNAKVRSDNH